MQSPGKERLRSDSMNRPWRSTGEFLGPAADGLPAGWNDEIKNEASGFGAERTSRAGTTKQQQTGKIRLTHQPLSGMTDLLQLREFSNVIFAVPGTHRIAPSKGRHTRLGLRGDRG